MTINGQAFVDTLIKNLDDMGIQSTIEWEISKYTFDLELKAQLRKDAYGMGLDYAVSRNLIVDELTKTAEIVAHALANKFENELELHQALKAYDGLSKAAKAAFNILCLQSYITLGHGEKDIADELYDSKLADRLTDYLGMGEYPLIATSLSMRVNDCLKGVKI